MLGALYQKGCIVKVYKDHLEKASDKFQGALSIDPRVEFIGIEGKHPYIINFILEKNQQSCVKDFIMKRNVEVKTQK